MCSLVPNVSRQDHVQTTAEQIVRDLVKARHAVTIEGVERLLAQRGFRGNDVRHHHYVRRIAERIRQVENFIASHAAQRSVCTLCDLEADICAEFGFNPGEFHKLNIGPLLAQPIVKRLFHLPGHLEEIPKYPAVQFVELLYGFASDKHGKRIEIDAFVAHCARSLNVPAEVLGCRIRENFVRTCALLDNWPAPQVPRPPTPTPVRPKVRSVGNALSSALLPSHFPQPTEIHSDRRRRAEEADDRSLRREA